MENMNREQSSFWQFSDQLRLHTASIANLSLGDSIWSSNNTATATNNISSSSSSSSHPSDLWKIGLATNKLAFGHTTFDRINNNNNQIGSVGSGNSKSYFSSNYNSNSFNKAVTKPAMGVHTNNRRNNNNNNINNHSTDKKKGGGNNRNLNGDSNNSNNNSSSSSNAVDKRLKTLPPSEALPRSEAVGGYIFVCNNDTMQENLKRELFGLPLRYRDSVRAITPGLPLFLYNYSTHQLHGIFEAASFGGTNIDPTAWEDKKSHGESRFPAQVKVVTRKICDPLEEDSFRPILHHYDGPKFRLELSVPEALALLDIFAENNA